MAGSAASWGGPSLPRERGGASVWLAGWRLTAGSGDGARSVREAAWNSRPKHVTDFGTTFKQFLMCVYTLHCATLHYTELYCYYPFPVDDCDTVWVCIVFG